MIEETAQTAIRCVHWTQESPTLGCQFAHRRGPNLGKDSTAMYRSEMGHVPHVVQLVRDDAEACRLKDKKYLVRIGA